MVYSITREIGIDAGHRVPTHGSKCANLHGHRYTVQATVVSVELASSGEQWDMVLDFGFLKDEMMGVIDAQCDHGMILWVEDPYVGFFGHHTEIAEMVRRDGSYARAGSAAQGGPMKILVVPFIPTAERLAEFWYGQLASRVKRRSEGRARLACIKVYETPNCSAEYPGI